MATILDGKKCSEMHLELIKEQIEDDGLHPHLATVIVGNDPASQMYVRMKHRACERVGIGSVGIELPGDRRCAVGLSGDRSEGIGNEGGGDAEKQQRSPVAHGFTLSR